MKKTTQICDGKRAEITARYARGESAGEIATRVKLPEAVILEVIEETAIERALREKYTSDKTEQPDDPAKVKFLPTPAEIEERAREIRERGFRDCRGRLHQSW